MKLPCFEGAWPAFWTLEQGGKTWPEGGEIDIVEAINDKSITYGTAHWPARGFVQSSGSSTGCSLT